MLYSRSSLEWQKNYVVEKFSANHPRAIISWDHYLTTLGEAGSGDSLSFFIECTPTTFKQKVKINNILIYEL